VHRFERQRAARDVADEARLRLPADAGGKEIGNLCDDERRDDQRPWMGLQQLQA
jgi:hypothetical protein